MCNMSVVINGGYGRFKCLDHSFYRKVRLPAGLVGSRKEWIERKLMLIASTHVDVVNRKAA